MPELTSDSYRLSSSVQLMENIYPGKPVVYTNKMFTAHDKEKSLLVFTIDDAGHPVLLQKSSNNTGFIETFLDEGLPAGARVTGMAVTEGREEGSSIVAVVVEKDGVPSIWYTILYSDQARAIREEQIKTLFNHKWTTKGEFKGKRIEQITVGYSRDENVQVAFSAMAESGSDSGAVYMFVGSKGGKLDEVDRIDLPEKAVSITGIGIGHDDDLERDYPEDVHGTVYILYKTGDSDDKNRMFSVTYPGKDVSFKREVPVNHDTTTFSLVDRNGSSLIFAASKDRACLYDEDTLRIEKAGFSGINENALEICKFDKPIKEFLPSYNESADSLHSFVLLEKAEGEKGGDFYRIEENASEDGFAAPKKSFNRQWKLPILHRTNVILASANFRGTNNEVYILEHTDAPGDENANYRLVVQQQGCVDADSMWHEQCLAIDQLDRKDSYEYRTYMVNVKLHDLPDPQEPLDYSKEEIKINCPQNVMLKINNECVHTANDVLIGKLNSEGICVIEVPAASIDFPLINIESKRVQNVLRIDPALHVKEKLDKYTKTEDDLKKARIENRDGSDGDYLVPAKSHGKIQEVLNAIAQLKIVTENKDRPVLVNSIDVFDNAIDTSNFEDFTLTFDAHGNVAYRSLTAEDVAVLYAEHDDGSYASSFFDIGSIINLIKNAITSVAQVAFRAIETGLEMVVRIGAYLFRGVIKTAEQTWHVISVLLQEVLDVAADAFIDFLSFLFPWEEIKRAKRALAGLVNITYRRIGDELDGIKNEKKIKQAFKKLADELFGAGCNPGDDVIKKLKAKMGDESNKTLAEVARNSDQVFKKYMETPEVQWSKNLLSYQLSSPETGKYYEIGEEPSVSVEDSLIEEIGQVLKEFATDAIDDVRKQFSGILEEIKKKQDITIIGIIEKILKGIGKTVLDLTGDAFQAAFDIARAVLEKVWSLITQEWEIGWLGRVYKKITDGDMTVLGMICLATAVPATVIVKAIDPNKYDVMPEQYVKLIDGHTGSLEDLIKKMSAANAAPNPNLFTLLLLCSIVPAILSIFNYMITATSWFVAGIVETLTACISTVIIFVNLAMNMFLSFWSNFMHKFEDIGDMAELIFIFAYGLSCLANSAILVLITRLDPITKKGGEIFLNAWSCLAGVVSLLGTAVVSLIKGFTSPVAGAKLADFILSIFQNVAGSLADASAGVAGGLILIHKPASDEGRSAAPDPMVIAIGIAVFVYASSAIGFALVYIGRLITWSCGEHPWDEYDYLIMYR